MKDTTETLIEWVTFWGYIYNLIYGFVYLNSGLALLNIFIPFAVIYDLVIKFGRF